LLKEENNKREKGFNYLKPGVYISCSIEKINRFGSKQERLLLVTDLNIYNLS